MRAKQNQSGTDSTAKQNNVFVQLTQAEQKLIEFIRFKECSSDELKQVHDNVVYHSRVDIDEEMQGNLYSINHLAKCLFEIEKEEGAQS